MRPSGQQLHFSYRLRLESAVFGMLGYSEQTAFRSDRFVPLCAIFVPWNFWRRLVIDAGFHLTYWKDVYFLCMGWERVGANEKARQTSLKWLI